MSKDWRAKSDKSSEGIAMSLKIADKPKTAGAVSSESWLASLAKLAARMSAPPPRTQDNQA